MASRVGSSVLNSSLAKDDAFQQTTLPGWEDEQDQERRDRVAELTRQAVEQYVREELGGLEQQSERFQYLFRRLLRSVQAVVDNVTQEIWASKFRPISFELGFGNGKDLPPVELTVGDVTLSITGFVDRVDGWEKDGRLYLRVVDYKTGRKSFDLTEVWNGLGLQMLLYLFTLEDLSLIHILLQHIVDKGSVLRCCKAGRLAGFCLEAVAHEVGEVAGFVLVHPGGRHGHPVAVEPLHRRTGQALSLIHI